MSVLLFLAAVAVASFEAGLDPQQFELVVVLFGFLESKFDGFAQFSLFFGQSINEGRFVLLESMRIGCFGGVRFGREYAELRILFFGFVFKEIKGSVHLE